MGRKILVVLLLCFVYAAGAFASGADEYYEKGRKLSDEKKYLEAKAALDKAIELDGTKEEYYAARAGVYVWLEDFDSSLADIDRAMAIKPHAAQYNLAGLIYNHRGQYEKAITFYTEAIKRGAKSDYYYNRGKSYANIYDYRAALKDAERALRLAPDEKRYSTLKTGVESDIRRYNGALDKLHAVLKGHDGENRSYLENVYACLKDNKWNDALDAADKAIRANGSAFAPYEAKALVYESRGMNAEYLATYGAAIKDGSSDAAAYKKRGAVYKSKGHYDNAIADLGRAIDLSGYDAELYRMRAECYYSKGDYQKTFDDVQAVIGKGPAIAQDYALRGWAYAGIGDVAAADGDFTAAINMQSKNPRYYMQRAKFYETQGRYADAGKDIERYIALKAGQKEFYLKTFDYMGAFELYVKMGNNQKALEYIDKVIKLNPQISSFYSRRAGICQKLNMFDDAIADYTKVIALEKQPKANTFNERGNAYCDKGEYQKAVNDFTAAIELGADDLAVYYANRGYTRRQMGEYDAALLDYAQSIAIEPKNADNYTDRAKVYELKEEYNKAVTDYSMAIELNKGLFSGDYNKRGLVYIKIEEYDKAIADFDKALSLRTNDYVLWYNKATACERAGYNAEARHAWYKVLEMTPKGEKLDTEHAKKRIVDLAGLN